MKNTSEIVAYVRDNYSLSREQLIDGIEANFKETLSQSRLSSIFSALHNNSLENAIEAVNKEAEEEYQVWEHEWKLHYIFHTEHGVFRIPVKQIDGMFKDYSRKGNNLSGEAMRQKYKLKPQAWDTIKRRLKLQKDSHVISPYTLENSTEEEEDILIEEAIADHIDSKVDKFVKTYDKEFKKRAELAMRDYANFEYRLELLKDAIAEYQQIDITFPKLEKQNSEIVHIVLSDIHFGKIGHEMVVNRFWMTLEYIKSRPESIIYITCLGDLVETLNASTGMHPWQLAYGTNQDFGYGFEAILKTRDLFIEYLTEIRNAGKEVYFFGKTWNHDRHTAKKEDDIERSGWLIIYEMLSMAFSRSEWVNISYEKERITTTEIDGIVYILHHGDDKFTGRKSTDIAWKNALDTTKHTIILSGDIHNGRFTEDKNITRVTCRALAGQGIYDKSLDLHSLPWFLTIKRNAYNLPDVTFNSLPH
jgi:hypothetical protein